jgi:hypothetical protein
VGLLTVLAAEPDHKVRRHFDDLGPVRAPTPFGVPGPSAPRDRNDRPGTARSFQAADDTILTIRAVVYL